MTIGRDIFDTDGRAALPPHCVAWAPRANAAPRMTTDASVHRGGKRSLRIEAAGDSPTFGQWRITTGQLPRSTHIRVVVFAQGRGVDVIDEAVTVQLAWLDEKGEDAAKQWYGRVRWQHVPCAGVEGDWRRYECVVERPAGATRLRIDLGLHARRGCVWFDDLTVTPADTPSARPVMIAAAGMACPHIEPLEAADFWVQQVDGLDAAADLVVLPEYCPGAPVYQHPDRLEQVAATVPGPATDRLAAVAARRRCHIVYNLIERDGGALFNTSVLLDRAGHIIGRYRKVHLAIFESWAGITAGDALPVFDTDFGRIGMAICWDNQFPETFASLARQGAEVVALSTAANFWPQRITVRAIDNAMVIVEANSNGLESCIVAADGTTLDVVQRDESPRFAAATVDLGVLPRIPASHAADDFRSRLAHERRPGAYAPLVAPSPALNKEPRHDPRAASDT